MPFGITFKDLAERTQDGMGGVLKGKALEEVRFYPTLTEIYFEGGLMLAIRGKVEGAELIRKEREE